MAHAASTALAERYKALGFHVIQGGKDGTAVEIHSRLIFKAFGFKRHGDHFMRAIEPGLKELFSDSNLSHLISVHCRESTFEYRGQHFKCYIFSDIGFNYIAVRLDAKIAFLMALGIDALKRGDVVAQERYLQLIEKRSQELRARVSKGQAEIAFDADTDADEALVETPHEAEPAEHNDFWIARHDTGSYRVSRTYDPAGPMTGWQCIGGNPFRPIDELLNVGPDEKPNNLSIRFTQDVPLEVLETNFRRAAGEQPYVPIVLASIGHWWAKARMANAR